MGSSSGPTPGLLLVRSKPTHPELSEETYNKWYSTQHIQDVVDGGLADLALRYKNVDPKAEYPYLALYRVPDLAFLQDEKKMGQIPSTSDLLPGKEKGSKGGDWKDVIEAEIRPYAVIQKFEGQNEKPARGPVIVMVGMEPKEGTDDEFDEWYRKQHLDMLSMVDGYHRSTRYKLAPGSDPKLPSYLALHEYESKDMNGAQLKLVVGSEWSKKIIAEAKQFDRSMWEFITEYQKGGDSKL